MIFDVFMDGRFICHFPLHTFDAENFLREVYSAFEVDVIEDGFAKRIELL